LRKIHWSILKRLHRLFGFRYRLVKRQGARFILDNKNWIDTRLLIGHQYERDQISSCIALINANSMDTLVDVGANIGVYSVLLNVNTTIRETLAFEPVKCNYNQLCGNIFVNNLNAKVTAINKALSDHNRESKIHIDPESTGVSRMDLEGATRKSETFTKEEAITCVKLDDIYNFSERKIFIKIDVEGHEIHVIRGMKKTLSKNKVVVQVELLSSERVAECDSIFESEGFHKLDNPSGDFRYANFTVIES